ncbi:NtaA/DmoA family FMN-dependent monooxygenase [Leucobacter weissii]|uniref:NtaA/DmoA family FMN-dependent monooxygenase n=1 Tax=Leucobacter weissii TaxID=1983706 RepID=A0A939MK02_9MICO|nr:NtaA/DmoA family FMN-dependent monooxygenase [Leucobacter weissii]MBO1902388.1 NtaA/DmoA family FMN-dependent monooxygenase [Leucobacter weissii]
MTRPRLHFNAFVQIVPSHHRMGLWSRESEHPMDFNRFDTWQDIAQTLERGRFDGLFIADHLGIHHGYQGSMATNVREGICFPDNDAILIAAALSGVTEHLGLIFTSSIFQNHPFELARLSSTLDHLSGGRAGWNLVTSSLPNAFRNLGHDGVVEHDERYRRSEEFLEVLYKLWEGSWDDGAVVKRDGVYADPTRIHRINHVGEQFSVEGPHLSEPSPQVSPFLFLAGVSTAAQRVAGRRAEAATIVSSGPDAAARIVESVRSHAVSAGRDPGDVKIFNGLKFVIGSTEAEAERKHRELLDRESTDARLAFASGVFGVDLGGLDPDAPLTAYPSTAHFAEAPVFRGVEGQAPATIRDLAFLGEAHPLVGTPERLADELERWQDAGIDGINVEDYQFHGGYRDFVDHLIPVLQDRGLAQRDYAPGTFREKIFGAGSHRLNPRHFGAQFRGAFTDNDLTEGF